MVVYWSKHSKTHHIYKHLETEFNDSLLLLFGAFSVVVGKQNSWYKKTKLSLGIAQKGKEDVK